RSRARDSACADRRDCRARARAEGQLRDCDAARGGATAVDRRRRCPSRRAGRHDGARSGAGHRLADSAERVQSDGVRDHRGHGTGHGLGIEVHEDPRITRRRADVDTRDEAVETGMVFTIEPGAYLPDWGGVRIEDDVLVTPDGVEVLTSVTTELIEI